MVDVRRFKIYVATTGVWKGYDYIVMPDGRKVSVSPGKYLTVFSEKPLIFGFEDMTEEIGESPDWDFDEPKLEVVEETGVFKRRVKLRATYTAVYEVYLYFDNTLLYRFTPGFYSVDIEFIYTEIGWLPVAAGAAAILFGLAVVSVRRLKKR